MKRNTLIAQIALGTFICLATAHTGQAMQEPQITLESADGRQFVLPQEVAFVSDYIRTFKTGSFKEAREEKPIKLDIPGDELSILVQIMRSLIFVQIMRGALHEDQDNEKAQAAAVAQIPQITPQNIGALINDVRFLQLPESCITGLINRLAEFVNKQVTAGKDVEIPFDDRKMLTQLGRTYFLKYDQDLELPDADGNPIDIGGFSIRDFLDAGRQFPIRPGQIEHGIFLLDKVPSCDLSNQRINSLEGLLYVPEIEKCQALDLHHNQISSIQPGAFQGLTNLEWLHLDHNQISSIQPGTFQELVSLRRIHLNNNQITSIQPGSFQGLSQLEKLLLNNNRITSIQPGTFQGLQNLGVLELDHNQISSIQPGTFQGLSKLWELNLKNNQISTIQPGTFQGLTNLLSLILRNNQISTIQPGSFQGLPSLFWFELSSNRLSADTISMVRQELPDRCGFFSQYQREETPEERRERLAEAAEKRKRQQEEAVRELLRN